MVKRRLPNLFVTGILMFSCILCISAADAQNNDFGTREENPWSFSGHSKYQFIHTLVPNDSVLQTINGDSFTDHNFEARLISAFRKNSWRIDLHGQLIATHSDSLKGFRELPPLLLPVNRIINDDRRWFNLTHELNNEGRNAAVVRLDRLNVGYIGEKTVIRFGRQAISWGNGLLFTPMDILNPFDPAAVDREYKSGDDMIYGQYLFNNGSDFQLVGVVRRAVISGEVDNDKSSLSAKYHGFIGSAEYDLLAAKHYGDDILAAGFSTDFIGAVWRADLVWTGAESENVFSSVIGASYSGVVSGHNWTGFIEYYFNGFGQSNGDYSAPGLKSNPELLKRLARGELFNLARHYLGASVTIEISPLFNLTPNLFINIQDPSALAQLVFAYDWKQDLQVLGALNVPLGSNGTEYGGIESSEPGLYISTGVSVFVQLAWYF